MRACKDDRYPAVSSEWTKGNEQKLKYRKFHLNIRKTISL